VGLFVWGVRCGLVRGGLAILSQPVVDNSQWRRPDSHLAFRHGRRWTVQAIAARVPGRSIMNFDMQTYIALVGAASVIVVTVGVFVFLLTRGGK